MWCGSSCMCVYIGGCGSVGFFSDLLRSRNIWDCYEGDVPGVNIPSFNKRKSNIKVRACEGSVREPILRHLNKRTTLSYRYIKVEGYSLLASYYDLKTFTWWFLWRSDFYWYEHPTNGFTVEVAKYTVTLQDLNHILVNIADCNAQCLILNIYEETTPLVVTTLRLNK